MNEERLARALAHSRIPERMHGGMIRYITRGIKPGDFLTAVLSNDLREACGRADDENKHLLWDYIAFLYNHAPRGAWGSADNFRQWVKQGGLQEDAA